MLQLLRRELKLINDVLMFLMAYHIQVGFACKKQQLNINAVKRSAQLQ